MTSKQTQPWKQATLGDVVASMKNGIYKPRDAYCEDGIACLRMYNIDGGQIVWKDIKRMRLSDDEKREYGLLPGDLLVNRVNSRELVGKAAAIPSGLEECVFESKNIRVRLKTNLADPRFVSFALQANGQGHFNRNAQQVVGMASISQPQVALFPLPLPPLPEQRRVVAEIEKQFTRLEAGVAALRRVQANLKRYRAAVLKAACEGPWPAKTLRDCFKVSRGRFGHRPRNEPRFYNGRYPFVQIGDLPRDGGSITKHTQTLNESGRAISRLFPAGTVLIAIVGATIGNTGILTFDSCAPDSLVALESENSALAKFAEFYLQSKKLSIRATSYASGGQPNINLEFLRNYPFPLPPLAEQTRIVAEMERRLSVVAELESLVSANLQRATRLRQSILRRAFSDD